MADADKPTYSPEPPWKPLVVPYVQGELQGEELDTFNTYLEQDKLCQVAVYDARQLIEQLNSLPDEPASDGLTDQIMQAVRNEYPSPVLRFPLPRVLKVAACLALLVGGLSLLNGRMRTPSSTPANQTAYALQHGLDWLIEAQDASGAWDGQRWGGHDRYTVSLTGLSLLALTSHDQEEFKHRYQNQIQQSAHFLLSTQTAQGQFGGSRRGTRFDHAIATRALLEVYKDRPSVELKQALNRALDLIRNDVQSSLTHYRQEPIARDQRYWAIAALHQASDLGWSLGDTALQPSTTLPADPLVYSGRGPSTDINFYQAYIASDGLTPAGADGQKLLERILAAQELSEQHAGSWPLSEHIHAAGGRVFSTAMATLTLSRLRLPHNS